MDTDYAIACGLIWHKTADPEAGWELLSALQSSDPCLRRIAQVMLAEAGEKSMHLLEDAVCMGLVSPHVAGPCMAEILQIKSPEGDERKCEQLLS